MRSFGPAAEALGFWALVIVFEWWIEPTAGLLVRMALLVLLGLVPVASIVLHHEPLRTIGFELEGLGTSACEVGFATLGGAVLIVALGAACHAPIDLRVLRWLPLYLIWGILQQFALQSFVHRRLLQSLGRPQLAALMAALLFGSTHLPNPVLVPATTVAGWVWCRLYLRTPSLWTLAVSQAVLALLVLACLPPEWVRNLKVGPGYWNWP